MKRHFTYKDSVATSVNLPSLGLGCAALGNLYAEVSEADAAATLAAAWAAGIRYFDTAPFYGHGLSEQRLGAFLRSQRDSLQVSTKVGRGLANGETAENTGFVAAAHARPYFDYSADGVLRQVDASLVRMGRDRIDVAFVHDIGALTHGAAHAERLAERGHFGAELCVGMGVAIEAHPHEEQAGAVVVVLRCLFDVAAAFEQEARDGMHDARAVRTG